MHSTHEKRSSAYESATLHALQGELFAGVGGRQASPSPRRRGGGYQDICTSSNFGQSAEKNSRDARMDELREMGLQQHWLKIADEIGVDAFLKIWRILDRELQSTESFRSGRLVVPLRLYSTYLRYQRNRLIESFANAGNPPRIIRRLIMTQLHEKISIRNILSVIKKCHDAAPERSNP